MHSKSNSNKYSTKQITFSIENISTLYFRIMGLLFITVIIPFIIIYFDIIHSYFINFHLITFVQDSLLLIIVMLIGIFIHEAIHGITWALFVKKGLRAIKLGVMWKPFMPYCHCKGYLKVKHYIAGAIMPAIVLGFTPILWAFITGNTFFILLGAYFTLAASGDFYIIYLLRNESTNNYVRDHETEPGCIVYEHKN